MTEGRVRSRAEQCEACGKFSRDLAPIKVRSHFDLPAPVWCAKCRATAPASSSTP